MRYLNEDIQISPMEIKAIGVKKNDIVSIEDFYRESSGDFKLLVKSIKNKKSAWFTYDDKQEAQEEGWKV